MTASVDTLLTGSVYDEPCLGFNDDHIGRNLNAFSYAVSEHPSLLLLCSARSLLVMFETLETNQVVCTRNSQ